MGLLLVGVLVGLGIHFNLLGPAGHLLRRGSARSFGWGADVAPAVARSSAVSCCSRAGRGAALGGLLAAFVPPARGLGRPRRPRCGLALDLGDLDTPRRGRRNRRRRRRRRAREAHRRRRRLGRARSRRPGGDLRAARHAALGGPAPGGGRAVSRARRCTARLLRDWVAVDARAARPKRSAPGARRPTATRAPTGSGLARQHAARSCPGAVTYRCSRPPDPDGADGAGGRGSQKMSRGIGRRDGRRRGAVRYGPAPRRRRRSQAGTAQPARRAHFRLLEAARL